MTTVAPADDSFDGCQVEPPAESAPSATRVDASSGAVAEPVLTIAECNRILQGINRRLDHWDNLDYAKQCREEIGAVLDDLSVLGVLADWERITAQLARAFDDNLITRDEWLDGQRAKIVARDYDDVDESALLLVGEASITVKQDDVENACRRAKVIEQATGIKTQAFVVAHYAWPAEIAAIAGQLWVAIIQYDSIYHTDE